MVEEIKPIKKRVKSAKAAEKIAEENAEETVEKISEKTVKIAVIRCDIVSETCPGTGCFKAFNERKAQFENYDENMKMVAFFTCGGCSGRRVYRLLKALKKHEPDFVHLSSCMLMEDFYPRCPHLDTIRKTIQNAGIEIVDGTHH